MKVLLVDLQLPECYFDRLQSSRQLGLAVE